MADRNDKGKKPAIEKPKKSKQSLLIPVPRRMNAPLVIREPGTANSLISNIPDGFNKSKARTFSGRNPTIPIQQYDKSVESDSSSESDHMNNAEVSDDEIELDDNIESADPSNVSSSSQGTKVRRGYDLPRQRNPGDHPKTVSIFQNILRPDDIPRWFCPEIRYRFSDFWEKFEETDNDFRDVMWKSFKQWYIVPAEIHDAVHKLYLEQLASLLNYNLKLH